MSYFCKGMHFYYGIAGHYVTFDFRKIWYGAYIQWYRKKCLGLFYYQCHKLLENATQYNSYIITDLAKQLQLYL